MVELIGLHGHLTVHGSMEKINSLNSGSLIQITLVIKAL